MKNANILERCLIISVKTVVKPKFVCPLHSEAKQTETSESGAEKLLLQGQTRRMGNLCLKDPNFLGLFIGKIWGEGCRLFVGGEVTRCSRNLSHQPSGSNQAGVYVRVLSLRSTFSTWVGAFLPGEELRDTRLCASLEE